MYLILFMGGALAGQILAALPNAIFINNKVEVSHKDFLQSHPDKKWVAYTLRAVTLVSGLPILFFFMALCTGDYQRHSRAVVFFLPVFMFVGIGLSTAFYEISMGVTGHVYSNKATYMVHPNARNCGLMRIGIFTLVTIAGFYFCRLS
jgi:hypothetical protein